MSPSPQHSDTTRPPLPPPVLRLAGRAFGAVARLRGHQRPLHPDGFACRATAELEPPADGPPLPAPFDRPGELTATVRLSRGGSWPRPIPDLLGVALRLHDAHGPGEDQDLLLATSGRRPLLRRLLVPAGRGGFLGRTFTTVLPYRAGGRSVVFGLRAVDPPPVPDDGDDLQRADAAARTAKLAFELEVAEEPTGAWHRTGTVRVGPRLPQDESDGLTFDVWHTGPDIRPAGLLNRLRAGAYPGSRHARDAD